MWSVKYIMKLIASLFKIRTERSALIFEIVAWIVTSSTGVVTIDSKSANQCMNDLLPLFAKQNFIMFCID